MMMNVNPIVSVTDIVNEIKASLEHDFKGRWVEGEISNFSCSSAGHWYLTLADQDACLSGAIFKMDAYRNPLIRQLKTGDKVRCFGDISVYSKRGSFQLIIRQILLAGAGSLQAQLEILKKQLAQLGLFDLQRKRKIPYYPQKIAVITALQGAALADFLQVLKRRKSLAEVLIVPSLVQGDSAPLALIAALEKVRRYHENVQQIDVTVLTRGGGSLEDLWCFNSEALARAIFAFPLPVISAVGHEIDYTICDEVADFRCETPTACAEILSQGHYELMKKIMTYEQQLKNAILLKLQNCKMLLAAGHPNRILNILWAICSRYQMRLEKNKLPGRLYELTRIHEKNFYLDEMINLLTNLINEQWRKVQARSEELIGILRVLDPKQVLERGYSFLLVDNQLIKDREHFNQLSDGQELQVVFKDGDGHVVKKSREKEQWENYS